MYHYNLLPPKAKKNVTRWIVTKQVQMGMGILSTLGIVCSLILWGANAGVASLITAANAQSAQSIQLRSARVVPYDVDVVNQGIATIAGIQSQHINTLSLLKDISALFPSGVTASHIAIDVASQKITFSGTAKTRGAFQTLRDNIQSTKAFTVISFPYDALTQPSNIDFQIVLTFTPAHYLYE